MTRLFKLMLRASALFMLVSCSFLLQSTSASADTFNTISGHFLDNAGHPVQAAFFVTSQSTGASQQVGSNASDGSYSVNVAPGSYVIDNIGPIRNNSTIGIGSQAVFSAKSPQYFINATSGNVTQDLLIDTVSLNVNFVDQNNQPISGAGVSLSPSGSGGTNLLPGTSALYGLTSNLSSSNTNSNGTATLTAIRGITYTLCATDPASHTSVCTSFTPADNSSTINLIAPVHYSISGHFVDNANHPIQAGFHLISQATGADQLVLPNPDGTYLVNVIPGKYEIDNVGPIQNYSTIGIGSQSVLFSEGPQYVIEVTSANVAQNVLVDTVGTSVHFVDQNSQPISGARVSLTTTSSGGTNLLPGTSALYSLSSNASSANTDSNGNVSITAIRGITYTLCATDPATTTNVCVSYTPSANSNTVNLVAPAHYNISGHFLDNSGNAVVSTVYLTSQSTGAQQTITTSPGTGAYSVNVSAGKYVISLIQNIDSSHRYGASNSPLFSSASPNYLLDASNANVTQDLLFDNVPINVNFTDQNNQPISNARVSFVTVPSQPASASLLVGQSNLYTFSSEGYSALTSATGSATQNVIRNVPYTVCARDNTTLANYCVNHAFATSSDAITISEGRPAAPANLSAASPTNQKPALTWNPVTNADHYNVYKNGTNIGSTTSPSYIDGSATEGTISYYVVAVYNTGTVSDPSTTVSVIYDVTAPGVTASANPVANAHGWNNGDVTLTYACTDSLSGVQTCPGSKVVNTEGKDQHIVSDPAFDKAANTATTNSTVSIDKSAPTISKSDFGTLNINYGYTLNYTSPIADNLSGAVKGEYYIGDSDPGIGNATPIETVNSTLFDTPVASNTLTPGSYNIHFRIMDDAGNWSTVHSGVINVGVLRPKNLTATTPTKTSPKIKWDASEMASGYNVYRDDVKIASISETEYVDTFASEGTHKYTVSATANGPFESPQTDPVYVVYDVTGPTVNYTVTPVPNVLGWNKDDVTVTFTCADTASSVTTCTPPQTVTNEGANQPVVGTGTDSAGNSTTITVLVNLDKTKPTLSPAVTPAPNADGWNNTPVTVNFNCADSLSGIQSCSDPQLIDSPELSGPSATGTAVDKADNTATSEPLAVKLDQVAPTVSAPSLSSNTIINGGEVTLSAVAHDGFSGLKTGEYYIGNTDPGLGHGTSLSLNDDTLSATIGSSFAPGVYKINVRSKDAAGNWSTTASTNLTIIPYLVTGLSASSPTNVAPSLTWNAVNGADGYNIYRNNVLIGTKTGLSYVDSTATEGTYIYEVSAVENGVEGDRSVPVTVVYDTTAPSITYALSPVPNANLWNKGDVTVTFTCDDTLSGIKTCTSPVTVSTETADQAVTGTAEDNAGNIIHVTAHVKLDKINPTIVANVSAAPNSHSWNKDDVTVTFTCNDALSGIDTCPDPVTVSSETPGRDVTGTATDKAGNTASITAHVKLDKTAPTITASAAPAGNANSWNKDDVTVTFTCADALSGVDICPSPVTVNSEGANQTVTGTAVDKAGNTASTSVTVSLDKTAPVIGYSVAPAANANGWNNSNVTVTFSCNDALSGVDICPSPVTVSADGVNQAVTGTAVDKAGNTASVTAHINLDKTAPAITASVSTPPNSNNWNNGAVTITFNCSDALSTVDTCTAPVTLTSEGKDQVVTGTAVDKAGNTSTTTATVSIDSTKPTIVATQSPAANADGWNNSNVTVSYTCDDSLSGVHTCSTPDVLTNQGADQSTTGNVTDNAGNTASVTAKVNIDKTNPTISYSASPAANGNGWNKNDVTVTFTCGDTLSGVKICPDPITVNAEASDQTVTGVATDKAGNSASTTTHIKLDKTAPTITATPNIAPNSNNWNNSSVTITFSCADDRSGVDTCTPPQTITTEGLNQPVVGTAVDKAGNVTTTTAYVSIDKTKPTIVATQNPGRPTSGWNNTSVTVTFTCGDTLSGVKPQNCTSPITLTGEGSGQSVTGNVTDNAGNTNSVTTPSNALINIDKTAPMANTGTVSNATIILTRPTETFTANAFDVLPTGVNAFSGISTTAGQGGEFYIGTTDPGVGHGTAMTYSSSTGKITGTFSTSGLNAGTYTVNMRSKDIAGNWSTVTTKTFTIIL